MKRLGIMFAVLTIGFSLVLTACNNQTPETPEANPDATTESQPAEQNEPEENDD